MNWITTVIISSGMFLLAWRILGAYFAVFFSILEERESRTSGDEKGASAKHQETLALQEKINEQLRQARLEGLRIRDEQVELAKNQATELLVKVAAEAEAELTLVRSQIAELQRRGESEVLKESENLAEIVVQRVLSAEAGRGQTLH